MCTPESSPKSDPDADGPQSLEDWKGWRSMMVTDWVRWSALSVLLAFGPAHAAGLRGETVEDESDASEEL